MTTWAKYNHRDWTAGAYADPHDYLQRRADIVLKLGPPLSAGDTVLDLACGDAGFADFLPDQHYIGLDASPTMIENARLHGRDVVAADLNDYRPEQPVTATTIFRAIYYARNRRALFKHIASYTERKLVFDLNPRQYDPTDVAADLMAAGFEHLDTRPLFAPQTVALPALTRRTLQRLETVQPIARRLLRHRFTIIIAASRDADNTFS